MTTDETDTHSDTHSDTHTHTGTDAHTGTGRVLVAVSDSTSGQAALHRGVREALDRSATLHLIRVWNVGDRIGGAELDAGASQHANALVLEQAVEAAHEQSPAIRVLADLCPGPLVPALVDRAAGADLLVAGSGTDPTTVDVLRAWVSSQVACPVLIVDAPPGRKRPAPTSHRNEAVPGRTRR